MENIESNDKIEKISKFIDENITYYNNYSQNVKQLKKIIQFITKMNYEPTVDDFILLLNDKPTLSNIIKSIKESGNKQFNNDEIIIDLIDAYCIINNIDIELQENESFYISSKSTIEQYLKEVSIYPTLNKEEEIEILKKIKKGDEAAYEFFINSNLKLVISIAKKYQNPYLELEDIIQEGNLGLIKALEKFDISKGYKFSTYAIHWIRSYIQRSIKNKYTTIRIPIHISSKIDKIKKAINQLNLEGIKITLESLSKITGFTPTEIIELQSYEYEIASLDIPLLGEEDNNHLRDFIPGTNDTEGEVINQNQNSELIKILIKIGLKERDIYVLIKRYGFIENPLTLAELGEELNITRERVRQIEEKALRKIRKSPYLQELYELLSIDERTKKHIRTK